LKYIGLDDNRVSSNTLLQIVDYLKNGSRGTLNVVNQASINPNASILDNYFPITDDAYPSMDVQMKASQLRNKI
jgi:hypothetical protein